jgi:hypothetical protein
MPEPFYGVGRFYDDFTQVSDEEVIELLDRASRQRHAPRYQGAQTIRYGWPHQKHTAPMPGFFKLPRARVDLDFQSLGRRMRGISFCWQW